MRILHVGSGFRPWRRGGLVGYAEDLMDEQVRRGHEVAYFFSGRSYPVVAGPRLRRWRRRGVAMLELVNSPLHDHGRQPELEVHEPRVEHGFRRILHERRPDVVHVHELAGLPSSVLDVARRAGVPTVVTLQDYFALCPTFRLLDAQGRVCLRREIGVDCVATTAADARPPWLMLEATLIHDLARLPVLRSVPASRRDPVIRRVSTALSRRFVPAAEPAASDPAALAAAFQRRRDVNVERLSRADRLVAMSHRVAEIHTELGVDPARMLTLQLTLGHIAALRPRPVRDRTGPATPATPVTFATLAALESPSKGGRVLIEAVRRLAKAAAPGSFRVLVFGYAAPELADRARELAGVELRGPYTPADLDALLDEVDVGLMPSLWEEAYGYAGVEMLAKGIPVVANAIGGMVDYMREGRTGWLNRSCDAEGLARIMAGLVADMQARVRLERDAIVKPMDRHADEMDAVYRDAVDAVYR